MGSEGASGETSPPWLEPMFGELLQDINFRLPENAADFLGDLSRCACLCIAHATVSPLFRAVAIAIMNLIYACDKRPHKSMRNP